MKLPISPIAEIYQHIITRCLNMVEHTMVFDFIKQGNLDEFIDDSILQIESIVYDLHVSQQLKIDKIKTIAYSFLKSFNERLSQIPDAEKKQQLKSLLAKIARGVMLEIQQQAPSYAAQIRTAINHGLEQAVHVEGYNQKDFESHFQLNYTDISKTPITITSIPEVSEYLTWDNKKADIDKLIYLLQNDYFCIKSKSEFKSLFDKQTKKGSIRWNGKKFDLLILLVHRLYAMKILEIKAGKGLWKLVSSRFVDFDKNSLGFNPAKKLNYLKSKKGLNPALAEDIERIIKYILIER